MLDRELEQRVAPAQFQLAGDVVAVMFDGADADVERRRDQRRARAGSEMTPG
jgi:hypothetical protein